MTSDSLILYGESQFTSPYVFSCYVVLREKGVPFELRLLSLHEQEHRREDYLQNSLTGRVPSLQHGEFWLSESSAIDEYLEEVFPPPKYARLYPEEAQARARARQLQAWIRSDLMPLREERPTSVIFYGEPVKPLSPAGKAAAQRLLAVADGLFEDGAQSLFGTFTIADADLALMLHRLISGHDPVPPKLQGYAAAQWQRPSIREFVEHPRPPLRHR